MSDRESCNSRHFSWLMKSCFPNPHQHHPQPHPHPHHHASHKSSPENLHHHHQATISFLPDDLLLECLSRVPTSTLPSIPLVCRRWALLLHSPAFYDLRRRHRLLQQTLFAVSLTHTALHTATLRIGLDSSWKTSSFLPQQTFDALASPTPPGIFHCHGLFSHVRLSAIGPKIYIIGRTAMIRCDTWTGIVSPKSPTIFPRKKFAASVVGDKIFVAGGTARTSAVEEYDPQHDSWRVVSDAPRRRYGCIGAAVDGIFYVIGGLKIGSAGAEAPHMYASSMDLYDVERREWMRSRGLPGGGCVVGACATEGHVYILASHAVELSFWRFDGRRSRRFGEWNRMKSPPVAQVRVESRVRWSCVGMGQKVVLIQLVIGVCVEGDDRREGRRSMMKGGMMLVYDCATGEWSRAGAGTNLPELVQRAASCVCVEC